MKIIELLRTVKKPELVEFAVVLGAQEPTINQLKKKEIMDFILSRLHNEEFMTMFLIMILHESLDLLKVCQKQDIYIGKKDYVILNLLLTYIAYDEDGLLKICEDFAPIFNNIYTEEYEAYHEMMNWIICCSSFADAFYGCYSMRNLYDVVCVNKNIFFDDFEMFEECVNTLKGFLSAEYFKGYFISSSALEYGLEALENVQEGKPFYLPVPAELLFYVKNNHLLNEYYDELYEYFLEELDELNASMLLKNLWNMAYSACTTEEICEELF